MFCNDTKVHLIRHKAWIIFILNLTFSCTLQWRIPFPYLLSSPKESLGRVGSTWYCDKNNKEEYINGTRSKSNLMVLIHVIDANNSKSCSSWVCKKKKSFGPYFMAAWQQFSNSWCKSLSDAYSRQYLLPLVESYRLCPNQIIFLKCFLTESHKIVSHIFPHTCFWN